MRTINNNGFTLIELLVVVGIIGILASIVLVSVNSARLQGKGSFVVSTLHQMQNALELYFNQVGHYPYQIGYDDGQGTAGIDQWDCTSAGPNSNYIPWLSAKLVPGYISTVSDFPSASRADCTGGLLEYETDYDPAIAPFNSITIACGNTPWRKGAYVLLANAPYAISGLPVLYINGAASPGAGGNYYYCVMPP